MRTFIAAAGLPLFLIVGCTSTTDGRKAGSSSSSASTTTHTDASTTTPTDTSTSTETSPYPPANTFDATGTFEGNPFEVHCDASTVDAGYIILQETVAWISVACGAYPKEGQFIMVGTTGDVSGTLSDCPTTFRIEFGDTPFEYSKCHEGGSASLTIDILGLVDPKFIPFKASFSLEDPATNSSIQGAFDVLAVFICDDIGGC